MKALLTIFLFLSIAGNATNYYVDNAGSNAAAGTSTGTAWQTISKVNSVSFSAGDSIFFKRGGSWNERLNLPSSGNSTSVIYVGAYGSGAKPVFTALQTQTGFTNSGNVWTATATNAVKELNTVLVGGVLQAKARSAGYDVFSSSTGTTITTSLSGTPNYTGAELVVRTAPWVIDHTIITAQSGGVLTFSPAITYNPPLDNRYFIQNNLPDLAGEWSYDSASKTLKVYSTTSPSVQIASVDTLVYLKNKSYITFENITLNGANKAAFQLDSSNHITVRNCNLTNSGTNAISAIASDYVTIKKDSIANTFNDAIYMRQVDAYTPMQNVCNNALIDSNYIKNTGLFPGMGMNGNGRYTSVFVIGQNNVISHNRIDSSGYIALQFNGKNTLVKNNYVNQFCLIKNDGGGIYTVVGAYLDADYNDSSIIRGNIVVNYVGAASTTYGIYHDDESRRLTTDSNTVINTGSGGIYEHTTLGNTVSYNLIVNTDGIGIIETGNNSILKSNIFYSPSSTNVLIDVINTSAVLDSNIYCRPANEAGKLKLNSVAYSLKEWRDSVGFDFHGRNTPLNVTTATPLIFYNPTGTDSTVTFSGQYIDAKNNLYNNSALIPAYGSRLLFKANYEVPQTILRNLKKYKIL